VALHEADEVPDRTGNPVVMRGDEVGEVRAGFTPPDPDLLSAESAHVLGRKACLVEHQGFMHRENGVLADVIGEL
jgi:hypothetical protein